MVPGLPRRKALPGPDEPLTALSAQRSFLSAFSAAREGHAPASDALCRASPRGAPGFDPNSSATRTARIDVRPPPRQRQRSSSVQSAFHRRRAQRRSLSRCVAARRRRLLLTSTIYEHSPRSPTTLVGFAMSPCDDAVFRGFRPIRPSTTTPGGVSLLAELRQSSFNMCRGPLSRSPSRLEQDQIGSCRTGAAPAPNPRGVARDVHYPVPFGSDTFCRKLGGATGWRSRSFQALARLFELTGDSRATRQRRGTPPSHGRPAFAKPAASRPALAGRSASRTASHVPPRRGPRSAASKVSSIHEEHFRGSSFRPASQAKFTTPEGRPLSTGCSQPVEKWSAPLSSPPRPPL